MDINRFKKTVKIVTWVLAIAWMFIIFTMSSQVREVSLGLSTSISQRIVYVVEKISPVKGMNLNISSIDHLLRKFAHFFSYLLLGILVIRVLIVSKIRSMNLYALSLIICIVYAISDEFHQGFVPGRGPQIFDVMIDSTGSFIGLLLYRILIEFKKRKFK